jgi:hypothetical protein
MAAIVDGYLLFGRVARDQSANWNPPSNSFASIINHRFQLDAMQLFVGFISDSFHFLTDAVWAAVAKRLVLTVLPPEDSDRRFWPCVQCPYTEARSLNGIIAYLTRKHRGSVIDKGVISVTAGGIYDAQLYPLRALTDFASGVACFITPDMLREEADPSYPLRNPFPAQL